MKKQNHRNTCRIIDKANRMKGRLLGRLFHLYVSIYTGRPVLPPLALNKDIFVFPRPARDGIIPSPRRQMNATRRMLDQEAAFKRPGVPESDEIVDIINKYYEDFQELQDKSNNNTAVIVNREIGPNGNTTVRETGPNLGNTAYDEHQKRTATAAEQRPLLSNDPEPMEIV